MQAFIVPVASPYIAVAQAIVRVRMSWLLDAHVLSYSNALIMPDERLSSRDRAALRGIGARECDAREIGMLVSLQGKWGQWDIPQLHPFVDRYVCVSSINRVIGDQYRIEAYVAAKGQGQ